MAPLAARTSTSSRAGSHELAAAATDRGDFADQLAPVPAAPGLVAPTRACAAAPRRETLAKLKPSFREDGVIHAGNASQISDGASALLMATPERAARAGAHADRALPLRGASAPTR